MIDVKSEVLPVLRENDVFHPKLYTNSPRTRHCTQSWQDALCRQNIIFKVQMQKGGTCLRFYLLAGTKQPIRKYMDIWDVAWFTIIKS